MATPSKSASHKRINSEGDLMKADDVSSTKAKCNSHLGSLSAKTDRKLGVAVRNERRRSTLSRISSQSEVTASRSSDVNGRASAPQFRPATQASTTSPGSTSSDAKKSWRNSVIAARQAFPLDTLEMASRGRSGGSSVSGRSARRQSLLQVAATQGHVKTKQDVYECRRATMLNPVSLVSSVGVAGAVLSESYYQQSVVDLKQQEKARRLREAMNRTSADPIFVAAEKHAFFQKNLLQHRKEQEAERKQATFGAMIQASLPANVTRAFVPPSVKHGHPSSGKSRMPHGPLIVPGANYVPGGLV